MMETPAYSEVAEMLESQASSALDGKVKGAIVIGIMEEDDSFNLQFAGIRKTEAIGMLQAAIAILMSSFIMKATG